MKIDGSTNSVSCEWRLLLSSRVAFWTTSTSKTYYNPPYPAHYLWPIVSIDTNYKYTQTINSHKHKVNESLRVPVTGAST